MNIKLPRQEILMYVFFVIAGILLRLIPHPWNFTPMTALALFAGVYLKPRIALYLVGTMLIVSDVFIGIHSTIPFVYGSFLLIYIIGLKLKQKSFWIKIIPGVLMGGIVFYLVSNLGVFLVSGIYPCTIEGLINCYVMALPFYRNALAGDMIYTTTLFGVYHLVHARLLKPIQVKF